MLAFLILLAIWGSMTLMIVVFNKKSVHRNTKKSRRSYNSGHHNDYIGAASSFDDSSYDLGSSFDGGCDNGF